MRMDNWEVLHWEHHATYNLECKSLPLPDTYNVISIDARQRSQTSDFKWTTRSRSTSEGKSDRLDQENEI